MTEKDKLISISKRYDRTHLMKLVKLLDLQIYSEKKDYPEFYTSDEILDIIDGSDEINNIKLKTKKMAKQGENATAKKYNNEVTVEQGNIKSFHQCLEDKGDTLECTLTGSEMVDFKKANEPARRIFTAKIEGEGEEKLLPSNYELSQKLAKLVDVDNFKPIDIFIEVTGYTKLDGGKKVKNFRVLTA